MSLTLSCKLVEAFAEICAVLIQNQAPKIPLCFSIKSRIFSRPHRISSLWRPFAMADDNLHVQSGATSENSVESEWQRVECIAELAQWLYCHELPLQDCVDLLHWAVDIALSVPIQRPSWLEPLNTEGGDWRHSVLFLFYFLFAFLVL